MPLGVTTRLLLAPCMASQHCRNDGLGKCYLSSDTAEIEDNRYRGEMAGVVSGISPAACDRVIDERFVHCVIRLCKCYTVPPLHHAFSITLLSFCSSFVDVPCPPPPSPLLPIPLCTTHKLLPTQAGILSGLRSRECALFFNLSADICHVCFEVITMVELTATTAHQSDTITLSHICHFCFEVLELSWLSSKVRTLMVEF
jgi:hypothetical protein